MEILDLDALLDEPKVARVKLGGQEYELMRPRSVEDFLILSAMADKSRALMQTEVPSVGEVRECLDELKSHMRDIIRKVVPGLSDEHLQEVCPDIGTLQRVMISVLTTAQRAMPATVKKN